MGRTLSITVEVVDGILHVDASGTFRVQDAKEVLVEVIEASKARSASRILIDIRALVGHISTVERFEIGKWVAEIARGDVSIALLDSIDRVWPDRFLENVAVARGARVKTTTSLEEALGWLGGQAAS
jgi:hypothetical protein